MGDAHFHLSGLALTNIHSCRTPGMIIGLLYNADELLNYATKCLLLSTINNHLLCFRPTVNQHELSTRAPLQ